MHVYAPEHSGYIPRRAQARDVDGLQAGIPPEFPAVDKPTTYEPMKETVKVFDTPFRIHAGRDDRAHGGRPPAGEGRRTAHRLGHAQLPGVRRRGVLPAGRGGRRVDGRARARRNSTTIVRDRCRSCSLAASALYARFPPRSRRRSPDGDRGARGRRASQSRPRTRHPDGGRLRVRARASCSPSALRSRWSSASCCRPRCRPARSASAG